MTLRLIYILVVASVAFFLLPDFFQLQPRGRITLSDEALLQHARSHHPGQLQMPAVDQGLAEFGRKLFFSTKLSADESQACANCHRPELQFADGKALAMGTRLGSRHTPQLLNVAWLDWYFWDGRALSLAMQARSPIETKEEHDFNRVQVAQTIIKHYSKEFANNFPPIADSQEILALGEGLLPATDEIARLPLELATFAVATLQDQELQSQLIHAAANRGISPGHYFQDFISKSTMDDTAGHGELTLNSDLKAEINRIFSAVTVALAEFQKTITAIDSPFDQFLTKLPADLADPAAAFTEGFGAAEWQGFKVFVASGCPNCHSGPLFTDSQFHNIGLAEGPGKQLDLGRAMGINRIDSNLAKMLCATEQGAEACAEFPFLKIDALETLGAFKTPSLRNVELTAPYFHDGSASTLTTVLTHYDNIETAEPRFGHRSESLEVVEWSASEKEVLLRFLHSLSSPVDYWGRTNAKKLPDN